MIGSNINKVLVSVFILLIKVGVCYAQGPTITPKKQPLIFPLDATGNLTITAADIATITPDATNANPTILIKPSVFTCNTRGQQAVTLTASDAPPPVTFNSPTGIVIDSHRNFFIADAGNHKIRKIDNSGMVTDFAGSGMVGINNGLGALASFDTPQGMAIDAADNLYVTDVKAGLIRKITPQGLVSTIAGTAYSTSNDKGIGFGVSFDQPYGIAIDSQGNLYVADATANRIRKVTQNGNVTTFAGSGIQGFADGNSASAKFTIPAGITIDNKGNLFVADTYNNRIRKITPNGDVTTIAGNGIGSLLDGLGTNADFNKPYNLIAGANGNIYVADTQNNAIRMIDPSGKVITIAGNGTAGDVDGVISSQANIPTELNQPEGLALDAAGILYVGDVNNNQVRQLANNNNLSTFAGSGDPGDTNGNINPGNFAVSKAVINVIIETNLKITTKYNDVNLGPCVTQMPDFVAANPPQTVDNCNDNIPAHQLPAVGTPLSSNTTYPVLIIVEDATGKYDTASFNAYTGILPVLPTVSITALPQGTVCEGSPITFMASTSHATSPSFQWQVNGVAQGTNNPAFTGIFKNGDAVTCHIISTVCSAPASSTPYTVSINPRPVISFAGSYILKYGSSLTLGPTLTGDIKSYKWAPADNLSSDTIANPVASPVKTTTYRLNVQTTSGCDTSAAVTVTVIDNVIAPNTFTPNGDNINDQWNIYGLILYPKNTVSVYNRYGARVFYSEGYATPWDGTYNRAPLPIGTYYYIIDLKNGSPKLSGPVTIIR